MVCVGERHGAAVARGKQFIFAVTAAVPDRADRVNDMPRRKAVSAGDLGLARRASIKGAALLEQFAAGSAMNRAIHTAATEQGFIRGVDDRINAQCRDIGDENLEPRRTDNAFSRDQAAGAPTVTPLSANICCSSPAWNISRTMSHPPTNSPLT